MDFDLDINLRGLRCPLPVLRTKKSLGEMRPGGVLRVFVTDRDAVDDIPAFVRQAGHKMESSRPADDGFYLYIRKQ